MSTSVYYLTTGTSASCCTTVIDYSRVLLRAMRDVVLQPLAARAPKPGIVDHATGTHAHREGRREERYIIIDKQRNNNNNTTS